MAQKPNLKLPSGTAHQKTRLLHHLQQHGSITTLEARAELDILMPAARIFNLKEDGYNIVTHLGRADTGLGTHTKIATYVLMPS